MYTKLEVFDQLIVGLFSTVICKLLVSVVGDLILCGLP